MRAYSVWSCSVVPRAILAQHVQYGQIIQNIVQDLTHLFLHATDMHERMLDRLAASIIHNKHELTA
jgi:hypothetical protein